MASALHLVTCIMLGVVSSASAYEVLESYRPDSCRNVTSMGGSQYVLATMTNGLEMLCDTTTGEGGWTVFQRRTSGGISFSRKWVDYKYGFGDYNSDFWWGLKRLHEVTYKSEHELYISFTFNNKFYEVVYGHFRIADEKDGYRLSISDYSGNVAADDLSEIHNGNSFHTIDRDSDRNCATKYNGGWWYGSGDNICHKVHLNGVWGSKAFGVGINWQSVTGYEDTAEDVKMMFRAKNS